MSNAASEENTEQAEKNSHTHAHDIIDKKGLFIEKQITFTCENYAVENVKNLINKS